MMYMFERYAERLPLELFVLVGAFVEEIISPIPSFVVLLPAGAAAQVQGVGWWYLMVLALLSACGRTPASVILYLVADKGEDWVLAHGRRFFGISHQQLERYGARLGESRRDWVGLFLLNAIPVVPTALLSLTCGFIKLRLRVFVTATFCGTALNALAYLSVGYAGVRAVAALRHLELFGQLAGGAIVLVLAGWFVYHQRKGRKRGGF